MSTAPAQTIPANLVRHIECETIANTNGQPSVEPLTVGGFNAAVCTAAVSPTNDRVVDITPVNAGTTSVVVNKSPAGSDPLTIPVTVSAPANIGGVQFVGVAGPDTPKP
jgi:hypothetical protein